MKNMKVSLSYTHTPVPRADDEVADVAEADWAAQDVAQLGVAVTVRGRQGRHIDGVSDWLVAGGVDHVP